MRSKAGLTSAARMALWAGAVLAAGALLAGLTGSVLARVLPAGGTADPLPVYTSLSLAAEDEPLLPVWQRYDPERVQAVTAEEIGTSLSRIYEYLLLPIGICSPEDLAREDPPAFEQLADDSGAACYLRQYPLPVTLLLTDLYSARMMEQTGALLDLAIGWDNTGYQVSVRLTFPEEPAATAGQLDQAVELVQNDLCAFLSGYQEMLLGIPVESWYSLADGVPSALLDRLQGRLWEQQIDLAVGDGNDTAWETDPAVRLQQLSDDWMLDVQIVRLEDEVLLTLTDQLGEGMLCIYYDARLCCVSGAAIQLV